jgi:hypothetical protein
MLPINILPVALFLLGFVIGYISGKRRGEEVAFKKAPIKLRMDSLIKGTCPICSANYQNTKNMYISK